MVYQIYSLHLHLEGGGANNVSSEVFDIIKPGRRVKKKVAGSKMTITSDDSLLA